MGSNISGLSRIWLAKLETTIGTAGAIHAHGGGLPEEVADCELVLGARVPRRTGAGAGAGCDKRHADGVRRRANRREVGRTDSQNGVGLSDHERARCDRRAAAGDGAGLARSKKQYR